MRTIEQIRDKRTARENKQQVKSPTTGKGSTWLHTAMTSDRFNVAKVFTK